MDISHRGRYRDLAPYGEYVDEMDDFAISKKVYETGWIGGNFGEGSKRKYAIMQSSYDGLFWIQLTYKNDPRGSTIASRSFKNMYDAVEELDKQLANPKDNFVIMLRKRKSVKSKSKRKCRCK